MNVKKHYWETDEVIYDQLQIKKKKKALACLFYHAREWLSLYELLKAHSE